MFYIFRGPLTYKNGNKTKSQLVAQEDFSSTASCRRNIPIILQWVFGIFSNISKLLFIPRFLAGTLRIFRETLVWKYWSRILLWLPCSNCWCAGRKSSHSYSCWRWISSPSQSNLRDCGAHPASYSIGSGYLCFFSLRLAAGAWKWLLIYV